MSAIRKFLGDAGSTLAKLLLLIASLGSVLALGIPRGKEFAARTSVIASADALLEALHAARMEALARNTQVTICKSARGDGLLMCAESSAEWPGGWIVFEDRGAIGTLEASDRIIFTGHAHEGIESVIERPTRFASITFNPVGPITGPGGPLEVHLASSVGGKFERVICLSILGRAHVAKSGSCSA